MKTKLGSDLQRQAAELAAMPDERIDTRDIPEAPAESWQHARRPDCYRPLKKTVTLRLDMDVLAWFKKHTERGYQTEMNRVLRNHMIKAEDHDHAA